MKILIVQESDWITRNPLQQHHLAELLSLRGHEIRVIDYELLWRTQGRRELFSRRKVFFDFHKIYDDARVTVIRPGIVKIPALDYASLLCTHRGEIRRQIKEFKPDVVVGFGILNARLAVNAAHKAGIPFVYHWLDVLHWLIPFKPFQAPGRFVEAGTLRRSDLVVAVSDKMKDFLIKMGAPRNRTEVVKPGIRLKKFDPTISGSRVRQQYGIGEGDIVLFFMGWLYTFSGMKEVALELARLKKNNVRLLIVGEGDAYRELQRIRQDLGLHDSLILTGRRPYEEIPEYIAAADVCLLPADPKEKVMHDGLPAKIYEYLAMGKPMISTKLRGVMREFGDGNGVVYIDRPAEAVKRALDLAGSDQVAGLGIRARKFAESYDWAKITDRYERLLQGLAAAGRPSV